MEGLSDRVSSKSAGWVLLIYSGYGRESELFGLLHQSADLTFFSFTSLAQAESRHQSRDLFTTCPGADVMEFSTLTGSQITLGIFLTRDASLILSSVHLPQI